MVSTRKLTKYDIKENCIVCCCGASVKSLSLTAIRQGIKGFEGLVDLPGTVAASLYGNAGCYGCALSNLLVEATVLTEKGEVKTVGAEWFGFSHRSSSLKRGEKKAIILTATLRRENGNEEELKAKSEFNHALRKSTQPEAKNSLGSIFANTGKRTFLNYCITTITLIYSIVLRLLGNNKQKTQDKKKKLTFALLRAGDVEPYVCGWNWYQWKDERAHLLFWKYVSLHQRMFTCSDFEIEIKNNSKNKKT